MRAAVLVLLLAGCGRIAFDAIGDGGSVDPPLPDAATFTAPCDVATLVGTGDVAGELRVAAEGGLYRATWLDANQRVYVLGIERTGDAIAANARSFGPSAFLPQPAGADVALAGTSTVAITWGTSQTEVRQLIGSQLATGRSTSYTALVTDIGDGPDRVYMLMASGDLRVQTVDPAMLMIGPSMLVDMQMTEREAVIPIQGGALITAARPNADDCTVWAYSSALALLGSTNLPNDMNSCEEIAAAHAHVQDRRAVAYTYLAGMTTTVRAQPVSEVAAPGAPVTVAPGTDPRIASGGTRYRVAYRNPSGVARVATLTADLVVDADVELHATPVRAFGLASNDGEVAAVYATTSTPNEIWFKRFCGP